MPRPDLLTPLEIAKIACDVEAEGMEFYMAAAESGRDFQAAPVFEDLARQELNHLNTFREIYREMDEKSGGSDSTAEYLFDEEVTGYLRLVSRDRVFPSGEAARAWISVSRPLEEIIRFALEVEKNSILFYSEIVSHTEFADSSEILKRIIQEEKAHLLRLSRM